MARDFQELINETMSVDSQKRSKQKTLKMIKKINFLNFVKKSFNITQKELAKIFGILS